MKTSVVQGNPFSPVSRIRIFSPVWIGLVILAVLPSSVLKSQNCSSCCISSFPSITVYQNIQTGHGMGFGIEAGSWNKDPGKFSYFIGKSMVWTGAGYNAESKNESSVKQTLLSFYVKGQYKLASHFYVVASPGFVNLTYFEFQTGLRYVIPVTRIFGIGVEPSYAFGQQQFLVNANLHFALR